MKWLDFVKEIPFTQTDVLSSKRIAKRNELLFNYELDNEDSVFSRSDEDSFYSRTEFFTESLMEFSIPIRYGRALLAIKNYSLKPNKKHEKEYQEAINLAEGIEYTYSEDEHVRKLMGICTLEDALSNESWGM